MKNLEKMQKRKRQLDGKLDVTRDDKRNKPHRSNQKRYQGKEYMQGGGWFEEAC